jgi:hypothetical protein
MYVLDWCKLFADKGGEHSLWQIVIDVPKFEEDVLRHLGLDGAAFEIKIKTMHFYTDKFVARQDLEYSPILPTHDAAKKAVWFHHSHIFNHEVQPGNLFQLPVNIERGYDYEEQEPRAVDRAIR